MKWDVEYADGMLRCSSRREDIEIGEELKLEAVLDSERVELLGAALIVHDDGESLAGLLVVQEIHAVNASAQRERSSVVQFQSPRGHAAAREAEAEFHRGGVEGVCGHPTDKRGEQALRTGDESARGEAAGFIRCEERELGACEEVFTNARGEFGGLGGREVAPAAIACRDADVKFIEQAVDEAAALAVVHLEFLAFLRAESGGDEELEGALGELLELADRGVEFAFVERGDGGGGKGGDSPGCGDFAPAGDDGDDGGERGEGMGGSPLSQRERVRKRRRVAAVQDAGGGFGGLGIPQSAIRNPHSSEDGFEQFLRVLSFAPVVRGWDFFQFEAGEELLDVREDGRGVERLAVVAGGTATQHETRAAASAGDVGEVTFMRNLRARVETETGVVGGKQVALGIGEQDRRRGRCGEDAFVQP